jgi:hypothetical protein
MVIQTADSMSDRQADFLGEYGRPLQITYGYMRQQRAVAAAADPLGPLRQGLARNTTGTVLVSTRDPLRLAQIGSLL